MKNCYRFIVFVLLMLLFAGKNVWAQNISDDVLQNYTHGFTGQILPKPASSEMTYLVAGIYWLPDYLKDNTSRINPDPGDPDPDDPEDDSKSCSTYGFKDSVSVDTSLYTCTEVYPITGLRCYKDCVCNSDFKYTADNCLASEGKKLSGRNCDGKYENCVCKQTKTVSTGEKCDLYCENACVEKSCKAPVSLGTGEECSEHCASDTDICTDKKCKTSVSYDTAKGEYCAEKCASNNSVCTKKGCNKICKDTFTGSAPSNGYITTQSCSDCSGSYTIKTGWACNKGYHKSGSSCIADCTRSCYDTYTGSLPANASFTTKSCSDCSGSYTIKTGWTCKSGYTKSGNSCVASCKVGDILYSDATCSSSKVSGKTAIGIVAYMNAYTKTAISLDETTKVWSTISEDLICATNYTSAEAAKTHTSGKISTSCISGRTSHPAGEYCYSYTAASGAPLGGGGQWYLPAAGEWYLIKNNISTINSGLSKLSKASINGGMAHWSSSEYGLSGAWGVIPSYGSITQQSKNSTLFVRCMINF